LHSSLANIAGRDHSKLPDFRFGLSDIDQRNPRRQRFQRQGETFSRFPRYAAMTQPDIWYVAFGPDKTVKTDDSANGVVRSTRTFRSEVDAKLFAMQILAKGWSASAGTLNPHQPKQVVGASQIEQWAAPGLGG
jgi:hypothetical protein